MMIIFQNLFHFFLTLPKANATSILLFLLGLATLRVNTSITITYKYSPIAFPMELLLVSDPQNAIVIMELTENIIYFISKKHFKYCFRMLLYLHTESVLKSFEYSYKINCL